MIANRKIVTSAAALLTSVFVVQMAMAGSHQTTGKDIVETAVEAGSFNTLAAALQAADLVGTLKGDGPFTVLAPTDEAFAKLPKGTVESLLKPENKDQLVEILTYHVIAGKVPAKQVVKLDSADTVAGKKLEIEFRDNALFVNESRVVKTDIDTSNGVIHVIDRVLLPPKATASAGRLSQAERMIALAIDKGVPHYNHGNIRACADIYEMTARGMMLLSPDQLSEANRKTLSKAMSRAGHQSADDRAWTYRRAFDQIRSRSMAAR